MIKQRSALAVTTGLVAITIASKLFGFVREIVLLESLGVGLDLDSFLVFFGIVNLVTGALGICIVTNITPIAAKFGGRVGAVAVMRSALVPAAITWVSATFICVTYALYGAVADEQSLLLPIAVASIVPFSLLSEYQVGLLLSRNRRLPVICGNLLLSAPLVLALVLFDLDIVEYAFGLAMSFALRNAIFAALLTKGDHDEPATVTPAPGLFGRRFGKTLAGGSAILSMSLIYLTAMMVARQFGEGAATILGYSLKIPMLVLTSLWFVLGTGFFARLVHDGSAGIVRRIGVLTLVNFAAFSLIASVILGLNHLSGAYQDWLEKAEIIGILSQSLPLLPLIIFVPMIEMVQRLYVTEGRHGAVASMALAIVVTSLAIQFSAWTTDNFELLMWSPAIAALAGFIAACILLIHHSRQQVAQAGPTLEKGQA